MIEFDIEYRILLQKKEKIAKKYLQKYTRWGCLYLALGVINMIIGIAMPSLPNLLWAVCNYVIAISEVAAGLWLYRGLICERK